MIHLDTFEVREQLSRFAGSHQPTDHLIATSVPTRCFFPFALSLHAGRSHHTRSAAASVSADVRDAPSDSLTTVARSGAVWLIGAS